MLVTAMFSVFPGTPGTRQQMPRTIRSTRTPAWDASASLSISSRSVTALVLRRMRPRSPRAISPSIRRISGLLQGRGRHQQLFVAAPQVADEHVLEKGHAVGGDGPVRGHQAEVRVQGGGLLVVVAGADLGHIGEAAFLLPGDEADLAVALVARRAVDHMAARLLQLLRPGDVVALVEPGPQLHQDRHLFAVLRRRAQVLHHGGTWTPPGRWSSGWTPPAGSRALWRSRSRKGCMA